MTLVPAKAMFGLPFLRARPVTAVNHRLEAAVTAALPKWQALPRRSIVQSDGLVLSQYARLVPVRRVVARTLNIDLAICFAAGADAPLSLVLDRRIPPVLAAASVAIAGNFKIVPAADAALGQPGASAILSDRADLVAFADAVLDDVSSGLHAYLFIYDVVDVASREFVERVRQSGVRAELLPGFRSYAAFDIQAQAARTALASLLRDYAEALKLTPELLRFAAYERQSADRLYDALGGLLDNTWEACAEGNRLLNLPGGRGTRGPGHEAGRHRANALADGVSELLDPQCNGIAALAAPEYRLRADRIRGDLRRLIANNGPEQQIYQRVLGCYDSLWQFYSLVSSWSYHDLPDNQTFKLALDFASDNALMPKPFKPFSEYEFFYAFQEFEHRKASLQGVAAPFDRMSLAGDIDHFVRQRQILGVIEMLLFILRSERPDETIRWLDLGCGRGFITNSVRLEDCIPGGNCEIIGVDWNEANIRTANKRAAQHRTFLVGDAQDAVDRIGGGRFHVISGFEFLEHLEDPVKLLKSYRPLCSDFFIAGSPLAEPQKVLPAPNHIWSFNRAGFEEMFRAAGLTPTFVNEAYVGRFTKGLDWVTLIAGVDRNLPARVASVRRRA